MSENVEVVESEEKTTVSLEDFNALKAQFEQLAQSKDRILEESKGYKTKYQSLQKTVEGKEREELEAKEQWKELLEREKSERAEIESKYKAQQKQTVLKSINYEVARLANDAYDVNDVVNSLSLTEQHVDFETGKVEGVAGLIDELRKTKPYLFKKDVPQMNTKMPHYKEEKTELTAEQKLAGAFKVLMANKG